MTVKRRQEGWRYRGNVALRVLAGSVGAYLVMALTAALLARTLPMSRVEAVTTATMIAYLAAPAVTIWAFLARGPWRALAGVALVGGLLALGAWAAGQPA
ncbi:ketohydroxyglutarate aldolase [Sphingobium naphthae]|uniref:Ketohydroxyglutarate aldolase n=1 Tax=Sphingobium naphthae TaxID=1886786 RepID=A0ABU3ZZ70_9SPHN|nr:ketohydroxyglutarate aldolase [Sphingobium naphthae]MDV5824816.1 ketohydroxyglutarate aldolase [Sphingobium naphthae]